MSVNKVILIGNVGADPEIRFPEPGRAIASVSLATSERRGSSMAEVTEWHSLVMYGNFASIAEKYIRKGTKLYVEGRISYREYEDKYKIRRKKTEIIVENMELLGRSQA